MRSETRTTLRLDGEIHKRMRLLAIERETTFKELVHEALTQYLEHEAAKATILEVKSDG